MFIKVLSFFSPSLEEEEDDGNVVVDGVDGIDGQTESGVWTSSQQKIQKPVPDQFSKYF